MKSLNRKDWSVAKTLDPNDQSTSVESTSGQSNFFKIIVTGGNRAGESNILEVQPL